MKSTLLLLALTFLLSCHRDESVPDSMSPCVLQLIQRSSQTNGAGFTAIYRFKYQNRYVFYASSDCCDQFNLLFDQSCNTICAPDGGLSGKGDGKCADFGKAATEETLLWKRPQ